MRKRRTKRISDVVDSLGEAAGKADWPFIGAVVALLCVVVAAIIFLPPAQMP